MIAVQRYNPWAETLPIARVPFDERRTAALPVGFSFLVNEETGEIPPEPFAFLRSVADVPKRAQTGRGRDGTGRTYAYQLRPYAEACALEGRPFRYIDDEIVQAAVVGMTMGTTQRGAGYKREPLAQGVRTLIRCVDYANQHLGTDIAVDGDAALCLAWGIDSLYDAQGGRVDTSFVDAARRHAIRPLAPETRRAISAALVVDPAGWVAHGPSSRPGLEFAHGMRAGLRLVENLGVHLDDVMRITVDDPAREYGLALKRTKGADSRDVLLPGRLVLTQQAYARNERAACVARARELNGSGWDEPVELLVNGLASGRHVGEATQPSAIQRSFRRVQERLGMVRVVEGRDEEGRPKSFILPWHCYHDQRHSYAMAMYSVGKQRGELDPVAFVQRCLGHAQRSTTERIYLSPDHRRVAKVGDIAQGVVGGILGG